MHKRIKLEIDKDIFNFRGETAEKRINSLNAKVVII